MCTGVNEKLTLRAVFTAKAFLASNWSTQFCNLSFFLKVKDPNTSCHPGIFHRSGGTCLSRLGFLMAVMIAFGEGIITAMIPSPKGITSAFSASPVELCCISSTDGLAHLDDFQGSSRTSQWLHKFFPNCWNLKFMTQYTS